jgi:hypothetical protein
MFCERQETIMPSNRKDKDKGSKGRTDEALSGTGAPDLADRGNRQSVSHGDTGGTPAQGDSWRTGNRDMGNGMGPDLDDTVDDVTRQR